MRASPKSSAARGDASAQVNAFHTSEMLCRAVAAAASTSSSVGNDQSSPYALLSAICAGLTSASLTYTWARSANLPCGRSTAAALAHPTDASTQWNAVAEKTAS